MKMLLLGSGSYKGSLTHFRLMTLAKELGKRGHAIHVVVPSADKYNNYTPDRKAVVEDVSLIQPWQPATKNDILNLLPYLFTASLAGIRIRPRLIYLFKPTPITIIGLLPKFLFRAPLIVDMDDLGSEVMRLQKQSGLQVKLVALCERLSLRFADGVVVASTYLESMVKQHYPNKPVYLLSNGVDPALYVPSKDTELRNMVYYYGAVNRLSLIEGFLRSLPATFAAVPDATAQILGDGSALGEAKELAVSLGIADKISFAGWVEPEELPLYVKRGDVAICTQPDIPTVRAASNLKVFQYMSLGNVPVVSDVGDLARYVKDGQGDKQVGTVVPPNDSEALTAALVDLLKNKKRRDEMAHRARVAAETDYSWATLTEGLDSFLKEQLDTRSHTKEQRND